MSSQEITLTCIRCPRGCSVSVRLEDDEIVSVEGNACPRGDRYVRDEIANPVRVVTSSVPVVGSAGEHMVSVKTAGDIPKGKVEAVVDALAGLKLNAPVAIGDVVLANVCDTGVDVVATRDA